MLTVSVHRRALLRAALSSTIVGALVIGAAAACGGATAPGADSAGTPNGAADASTLSRDVDATIDKIEGDGSVPSGAGHDGSVPPPVTDAARLPDADTCGVCTGTCFGTRCMVVLASNQANPRSIAVNATGVYWTNQGRPDTHYAESAVMVVGTDGGAPTMIAATPGGSEDVVIADETLVVWTDRGSIASMPAGPPRPPVTVASGVDAAYIAMDGAGIYWTSYAPGFVSSVAWRADRDGRSRSALMQGDGMPEFILVHDGVVYWQAYGSGHAYETAFFAVGTRGSNPRTLASGIWSGLFPWAIPSTELYWGPTANPLQMMRKSLDGGAPVVVATEFTPSAMTADPATVYFTNDNSVYEMPTDGGAPLAVAWRLRSPYSIAVDDKSIYWTDVGSCDAIACSGAVLKLTPK